MSEEDAHCTVAIYDFMTVSAMHVGKKSVHPMNGADLTIISLFGRYALMYRLPI